MDREASARLRAASHATPAERAALGRAARRKAPRSSHLAGTPDSGIRAQLRGDAHLLNFRLLASPP